MNANTPGLLSGPTLWSYTTASRLIAAKLAQWYIRVKSKQNQWILQSE